MGKIQACGRLVQHHELAFGIARAIHQLREHTGQLHPLLLAAGKRRIASVGKMADLGCRHGCFDNLPIESRRAMPNMGAPAKRHHLHPAVKAKPSVVALRQHRPPASPSRGQAAAR